MYKKMIPFILISILIAALLTVHSFAADTATVYVANGASGTGETADNAVGTLEDAVALLKSGGNIVVTDAITVSGVTLPEVDGDLTISGDGSITLSGDLAFEKNTNSNVITLDLAVTASSGAAIYGGYNSIVFGESFVVTGSVDFYGGSDSPLGTRGQHDSNTVINGTVISTLPYSITVKNGVFGTFVGGNNRSNTESMIGSVASPLTVTVEGGTFNDIFNLSGFSFLADDATLTVTGGVFNCPIYVQGYVGLTSASASYCSRLTAFNKKYYAADGEINIALNGGTFNGGLVSAHETNSSFTQCLRGNFTLTIGEGATFASGTVLDATQVKAYTGESKVATLTCPDASAFTLRLFDYVNGAEITDNVEPLRVSFVGDSITEGVGAANHLTDSYSAQFAKLCEEAGKDVVVGCYGVGSSTVMNYGNGHYNYTLAHSIAFNEADSDYVLIALGTNDASIAGGTYGQTLHFAEMYENLLRDYGELETTKKLFTTSAIYRFTSNRTADVRAVSVIRPIQKRVTEKLEAENPEKYFYIDLYALLYEAAVNDDLFANDKLHPDAGGYVIYANKLYDAIFNDVHTVENFEMSDVYLSASGTLAGAGTADAPMSSLTTALGRLAPNATLHIIGDFTYLKSATGEAARIVTPLYMDKLCVVGEDSGATLTIDGDMIKFLSDVKLDNLTVKTTASSAYFCANWNNIETTQSFNTTNNFVFVGGQVLFYNDIAKSAYDSVESASVSKDVTVNMNGGSFKQFLGGNIRLSSNSAFGTYGGNLTITIGENVTIAANGFNGIGGQNYLSGTVNASVNSWPSGQLCRDYARTGGFDETHSFNPSLNTGRTAITFGEGVNATRIITGDFNGDNVVNLADIFELVKLTFTHDGTTEIHNYYSQKTISLINILKELKKLS